MASVAIALAVTAASAAIQYALTPRVKQDPIDKGKFDDIRILGSDYGAYYPKIWGIGRTAGNLFFSSGIDHQIINTPSEGGKGTPSAPATRTHIYRTDAGVSFCRGEIDSIERIWADADIIYNGSTPLEEDFYEAEDATLAGGASTYTDGDLSGSNNAVQGLGNGGSATFTVAVTAPATPEEPTSPTVVTRVSFFYKSSSDLSVDIIFNGSDTETHTFLSSDDEWNVKTIQYEGVATSIQYTKAGTACPNLDRIGVYIFFLNERFPDLITNLSSSVHSNYAYPKDLNDPSEFYNFKALKDAEGESAVTTTDGTQAVRIYTGTENQTQDASIMAWLDSRFGSGEGLLRTSAMRGIAYVMFDNRQLKQGRIENFSALIDEGTTNTKTVIEEILAEVGFTSSDWDTSYLTSNAKSQNGFIDHSRQSRKQLLNLLLRWHDLRLAEIADKLTIVSNNPDPSDDYTIIPSTDLRGHLYGEERPSSDMQISLKEEHLTPKQTNVQFLNPDLEYHNDTASSEPVYGHSSEEIEEVNFPIVADFATAQDVANVLHSNKISEDKFVEFPATPEIAKYTVGDVLRHTIDGKTYRIRIEKVQRQLPVGVLTYTGTIIKPPSYSKITTQSVNASANVDSSLMSYPTFPRNSLIVPISSKPIREQDTGKLGIYLAISGRGRGSWESASLYREMATDNYDLEQVIEVPAINGVAQATLGSHGDASIEDTTNTLQIKFYDDIELESADSVKLSDNPHLNLIRIGDEWIQFRTAVENSLESTDTYRSVWTLSNLLRGRFDTDGEMSSHSADEFCTVFSKALIFYEFDQKLLGTTTNFKAVTNRQKIEHAPIHSIELLPGSYTIPTAAVDLSKGDWVYISFEFAEFKVRKADGSGIATQARGYVDKDYSTGDSVYIKHSGVNHIPGATLDLGTVFLSETEGETVTAAPTTSGAIRQVVGYAFDSEYVTVNILEPIRRI